MDNRRELYKTNMFSPHHNKQEKRKLTQASRDEKRKILFQKQRNIIESPKPDLIANLPTTQKKNSNYRFEASTPMGNKENLNFSCFGGDMQENLGTQHQSAIAQESIPHHRDEEKLSKKQQYIQRLIAWKTEKKQQQADAKKNVKPLFLPFGKLTKTSNTVIQHHSFVPPTSSVSVVSTIKKRQSIYDIVPTPPHKKPSEPKQTQPQPHPRNIFNFASKSNLNQPTTKSNIFVKPVISHASSSANIPVQKTESQKPYTGAIAKARTLQCKQKEMPPPAQNIRKDYPKTKLAVSLKAKQTNKIFNTKNAAAAAIESKKQFQSKTLLGDRNPKQLTTPVETKSKTAAGNDGKFRNYVTSTQTKRTTIKAGLKQFDFSTICKTISPVKTSTVQIEKPQTPSRPSTFKGFTAKRALTLNPKKYNFIVQNDLDVTEIDSPIAPKRKDSLVPRRESKLAIPLTPLNENKIDKPQQIKQNHQTKTPRRSIKHQHQPQQNNSISKKATLFNFLVQTELDATNIESPIANNSRQYMGTSVQQNAVASSPTRDTEESTPTNKPMEGPINYVSPFVSVSRGKVNAKQEREKRNSIYLQDSPMAVREISPKTLKVETPIEHRRAREAVRYFRQQLANEIERLHSRCDNWEAYRLENQEMLQSNDGDDMINVTIGQTKLLTSKKFKQFSGLIDRCEANCNGTAAPDDGSENTKPISPVDLEGFWSMLGLQVDNVEKRFENIERWKANGWQDPDGKKVNPKIKNVPTKGKKPTKASTEAAAKPRTNNALREMMRKKKTEMREKNEENAQIQNEINEEHVTTVQEPITVFSPRRLRSSSISNVSRRVSLIASTTPGRICIVVPDRRSRSIARTVISVPSPTNLQSRRSADLLKTAVRSARRTRNTHLQVGSPTPSHLTSPPRTPKNLIIQPNQPKSILKTPGTTNTRKSVVFNQELSVKKFRVLKYDNDHQETDYDEEEKVHINDFKE